MQTTTTWIEAKTRLTPDDKTLVYRVVGFLEYSTSLRYLDELLKQLTPDELKAVDSLIQERPEFGVYTNIAKRVQAAPSTLIPVADVGQSTTDRRGLAWVMALARVEVGGVVATFVGHSSPFEVVGPSEYEMFAYRQLLLDGAQTHFWALANDTEVSRVAEMVPNTQTLAYIRRMNVARHFLFAAIRSHGTSLTSNQVAEAMTQKDQLEKLLGRYSQNVKRYMEMMTYSRVLTNSKSSSGKPSVQACAIQLKNEPVELAAGRARITTGN